jgi:hypothetical protein
MIRLGGTLGDNAVGALVDGVRHEEFELSGLVSTTCKTGAIISFYPDVWPIQQSGELFHWLERRWQMSIGATFKVRKLHRF